MARKKPAQLPKESGQQGSDGITKVLVGGFKSLARKKPYNLDIRPLTLLAGANSSGKSSAIQPLLLLKQTLEANFDPGPLLFDGPNARFSSTDQIFPVSTKREDTRRLIVGIETENKIKLQSSFLADGHNGIELAEMFVDTGDLKMRLGAESSKLDLRDILYVDDKTEESSTSLNVIRDRCFFELTFQGIDPDDVALFQFFLLQYMRIEQVKRLIPQILHLPGLRGNPERSYRTTSTGPLFPGTFEPYVASLMLHWKKSRSKKLEKLSNHLAELGLTWKVDARQLDASRVEIQVGRLSQPRRGGARDLVNITDVGFGISQTLPVVVALLTAEPGQMVYIEQPEIHLHPRAQVALAGILADAARRGVRVVAETHSALLLIAVQTLVAEGELDAEKVLLHWFQRDRQGVTRITTSSLDSDGAYGDWPEDFGEIQLSAQGRYLDAVERRLLRAVGGS